MTQTNYTREIAETICTRMSEGESLRAICRDPGMPSEGTVRGWAVRDVEGFDQTLSCRVADVAGILSGPDFRYRGR
jgi:Bacteriophage Sf6, terminase small subunit-like